MATELFHRHLDAIRNFDGALSTSLQMHSEGPLTVHYAPFDWVNPRARVVLVGITPGQTQAVNALSEGRRQLLSGATPEQALQKAKLTGAFSGPMRSNLVAMLDRIGLHTRLGLRSSEALFDGSTDLLQTSSVMPFPVLVRGENYSSAPDIAATPLLRRVMVEHFVPLIKSLPDAAYFPLGPVPTKAMAWLVAQGLLPAARVLQGLPHPSGANGERIQYFIGRKDASRLSAKTNAAALDRSRLALTAAVAEL